MERVLMPWKLSKMELAPDLWLVINFHGHRCTKLMVDGRLGLADDHLDLIDFRLDLIDFRLIPIGVHLNRVDIHLNRIDSLHPFGAIHYTTGQNNRGPCP
jgi:hypothetical protein